MNTTRRQFIGLLGAAAATGLRSRRVDAADQALTNWAGNYTYSSPLSSVTSVQQVQEFVRAHDRLRVLGTRHCFNGIADSTAHLLSVRDMNRVISIDSAARTVTIESGMSYGQLCPRLDEK